MSYALTEQQLEYQPEYRSRGVGAVWITDDKRVMSYCWTHCGFWELREVEPGRAYELVVEMSQEMHRHFVAYHLNDSTD